MFDKFSDVFLSDILTAELLAGNVEVVPEASGAICLTSFLMYSSASSTSSGVNCGQTLCGDILGNDLY